MKRVIVVLLVVGVVILAIYLYSAARMSPQFAKPENVKGDSTSAFRDLPGAENQETKTSKGSQDLQVTGPVWVEPQKP